MNEVAVVEEKKNRIIDQITIQFKQGELSAEQQLEADNLSTMKKCVFDKANTSYIKGIAIVMMIVHHFFAFPEWQLKNNMYTSICLVFDTPIELYIGQLCKLCVCIFAFISGYGIFITLNKNDMASKFKYCIKKGIGLLLMYWMAILLFFAPIFFCFKKLSLGLLIKNLLLYDYSLIYSGWYVLFYIEMLILILLYNFINIKNKGIWDFVIIIGSSCILNLFIPNIPLSHYFLSFMIGYMFSKYSIYLRYEKTIKNTILRTIISFLLLIIVFIVRIRFGEMIIKIPMVSIIAPILCYDLAIITGVIVKCGLIKRALLFLSKYCTWYWFLHAVFHSNIITIQLLGYFPKFSILIVIWVFVLLMPFVIMLNYLYNILFKRINVFLT